VSGLFGMLFRGLCCRCHNVTLLWRLGCYAVRRQMPSVVALVASGRLDLRAANPTLHVSHIVRLVNLRTLTALLAVGAANDERLILLLVADTTRHPW
jgi:hypothetical protein